MRMSAGVVAAVVLLAGCDGRDSDYYPYSLEALDVWVHDQQTSRDFYAGRVETSYFKRKEGAARCRDQAISFARANELRSWGYVCCTVTSSTNCDTKVR